MQSIVFNGLTFEIPDTSDESWGDDLTAYFAAIPQGALQASGGPFTLAAEVNFGSTYGLLSQYFKTRVANPAVAGLVRLAVTDTIDFRNNANTADLVLGVNSSDQLMFNGAILAVGTPLSQVLTGFSSTTGTITSADTILSGIEKNYGNNALNLPLAGGTMTGTLNMGSNFIINLLDPVTAQGASSKAYTDTKLALSGGTMSGAINMGSFNITSLLDPVNAQDAATKNYVQSVVSGLTPIQACYGGTVGSNLVGTYNNGASGVGATFTITATGAFTIDGLTPPINSRILIKDQTSSFQNGIYGLTTAGSGGVSPVLTRTTDFNTPAQIDAGDLVPILNGTVNANSSYIQTSTVNTVGTDPLVFALWTANPANYLLKANNLSDVASGITAFNNISGMTTLGDTLFGGTSGTRTRLAGNTSATKNFLIQTGTGSVSAAPAWGTIAAGDVPTLNQNTTGNALTATTASASTTSAITAASSNASYYLAFMAASTTGNQPLLVNSGFSLNPSTGTLLATTFVGNLTGIATNISGIAAIVNGGTGVSSVTTLPTASAWAAWDANSNLAASNFLEGYATTPTGASTTTLVVGSPKLQYFTGTTIQTVLLPVTSTLKLGQSFTVVNLSTGVVTVESSGGNSIQVMASNSQLVVRCIAITGTGTASWSAAYSFLSGSGGSVTSVGMAVPTFLSIAGSPVTSAGTLAVTYSGTALPVANGGTGVTSVTTAPAASVFAGWDANKNFTANNLIPGYATTATAASTTTLVVGSPQLQYFTGTTTQTVLLPVTSTLTIPQSFVIVNNSTGIVTVQSSGGNVIQVMAANTQLIVTCILLTGTTATSWFSSYQLINSSSTSVLSIPNMTDTVTNLGITLTGFGTTSSSTISSRRNGDRLEVWGTFVCGTTTAVNAAINLPSGYVIDYTKISSLGNSEEVGTWYRLYQSTAATMTNSGNGIFGPIFLDGSTTNILYFSNQTTSSHFVSLQGSGMAGSTDGVSFNFSIPIVGWTANSGINILGSVAAVPILPTSQTLSGSGNYNRPAGVSFIQVLVVGPGGGGSAGTAGGGSAGGTGSASTFGTSLLSAGAGTGGGSGSTGGAPTVNSPAIDLGSIQGGAGQGYASGSSTTGVFFGGGMGGVNSRSGAGSSGQGGGGTGGAGIAGSGAGGGGGGGGAANGSPGAGGGAGAWVFAQINNPAATYPFVVSGSQPGGTGGTGGIGGASGSGTIIVYEYYNNLAVSTSVAVPANQGLLGPSSGSGASPTFRALVAADLPSINIRYYGSSTSISGSLATVVWTNKDYENGSSGAMVSGVYTIQVTGKYQINCRMAIAGTVTLNNNVDLQLQKNGSVLSEDEEFAAGAAVNLGVGISDIISCIAGDTLRVQVSTNVTGPSIQSSNSRNYFSLTLVGV